MTLTIDSVFIYQKIKTKSRQENPLKFCGVIVLPQLLGNDALRNTDSDINRVNAEGNKCL